MWRRGRRVLRHELDRPSQPQAGLRAPQRQTTTGTTTPIERDGRTIESYWRNPTGLDRGEPSRAVYAFNVLVGHHGIFSLTPVWLLSFLGMGVWMFRRGDPRLRWWAAATAAISLACLAFYLGQPLMNRNYGGSTSGLRWMFWLAPLWLLTMLPMADVLVRAALDPRPGAGFAGPVGSFGQLSDVESLDAPLADEFCRSILAGAYNC